MRYSLLFILFVTYVNLKAQDSIAVRVDSTFQSTNRDTVIPNPDAKIETRSVMLDTNHSPKKAGMLSAILPGLGQAYNHKYWKIPIVYAAIGGVGYVAYLNTVYYNFYHGALIVANNPYHTTADLFNYADKSPYRVMATGNLSAAEISTKNEAEFLEHNDYYRRNRDLSYFFVGVLYLCNILDATVDGHLYNYNVDDNLSFHIQPTIFTAGINNSTTMGFSFNMKF
ncbi:MAG: DUF5683 domain-containing protein [Bacteroidetes bacterium]|nr:DUF5683 domain-containing protein [Bacteroidota bacterium]